MEPDAGAGLHIAPLPDGGLVGVERADWPGGSDQDGRQVEGAGQFGGAVEGGAVVSGWLFLVNQILWMLAFVYARWGSS